MDNLTEKYILELVKNLKDEPNPAFEIFKKNGEVASCNFIARTTGVVSGVDVVQLFYKKLLFLQSIQPLGRYDWRFCCISQNISHPRSL